MFSDALGVKVDTAPGINTRGDTRQLLPEGLYVHIAWESDPNDLSVFSPIPEDIPILEAYANASRTFHLAATTDVTIDQTQFGQYYVDSRRAVRSELRAGAGWRLRRYSRFRNRASALRPPRPDETDVTAVVLDCTLDDGEFILRDGGAPDPGPARTKGLIVTMRLTDGTVESRQHRC